MTTYTCSTTDCDMGVTGLTCGKCGIELEHAILEKDDGSTVGVSQCPKGCGKIKSPMCCGADMANSQSKQNSKLNLSNNWSFPNAIQIRTNRINNNIGNSFTDIWSR